MPAADPGSRAPATEPRPGGGDDLCRLSAVDLISLYRQREASPVEVVHAYLERIERLNPSINAYVTVLAQQSLDRARQIEARMARGIDCGPLAGVPVALKDLHDLKAGVRNTFGCAALADFVPPTSSRSVQRLEAAGAIVLGKTNTSELGHKAITDNPLFGPTRNPWALDRNAGGSSGGSAAAVAAGLACVATGSDGAGSIRVPASFCGVVGMKPTQGTVPSVSRPNAFRGGYPMAQSGPLTRSAADAALVLATISGFDPRDPLSLPSPSTPRFDREPPPGPLRIAVSGDLGTFPVDPEMRAAVEAAALALSEDGDLVELVDINLHHDQQELSAVMLRAVGVVMAGVVDDLLAMGIDVLSTSDSCAPSTLVALVREAREVRAVALGHDHRLRTAVLDAMEDVFDSYDVLLTPTTCVLPFANGARGQTSGPAVVMGVPVEPLLGWSLAYPFNLTGHPAASVPVGVSREGLPIGAQIVSRRGADGIVLVAAQHLERALRSRKRDDFPLSLA